MNPFTPTMVGPYEIQREVGRGGMGVVFLAKDKRLDRHVAIKALPDEVAADPERLQRFEREAKVLASLSHANIAGIYGVEEAAGRRYLVLEYIEGESLADRLLRGALPLDEAIDAGLQIATGIEVAHERGVIHRDLKPANVVMTSDDLVKVVDFGLAKGRVAGEGGLGDSPAILDSPALPESPTLTGSPVQHYPTTIPGLILGTAPYLSPEQSRGKPVDRRTDIWSFGCLFYECLTGRRAFQGDTISDTIALILKQDPDWSLLPTATPARLRELLARCLEKDPKRRLRDIGDARIVLEELRSGTGLAGGAPTAPVRPKSLLGRLAPALLALLGALLGVGIWNVVGPGSRAAPRPLTRLSVPVPEGVTVGRTELSYDGRSLVVAGTQREEGGGNAQPPRLYLRRMDRSEFEPIRGTERAMTFYVISPDNRSLLYSARDAGLATQWRFYVAPLDESTPPLPLLGTDPDPAWSNRPAWLYSGDLLMPTNGDKDYVRISSRERTVSKPRKFEGTDVEGRFSFTQTLPRDRGALVNISWYEGNAYRDGIGVLDLKTDRVKLLVRDAYCPRYSPTGHLLFTRGDALLGVPFDLAQLKTRGEPVAILDGLRVRRELFESRTTFELGSDGTLVFTPGGDVSRDRYAVVVGADGRISEWSGERQPYSGRLAASPDGKRFAMMLMAANKIDEIWVSERGRSSSRRLIAIPGADVGWPAWSRDGRMIAYDQIARLESDGVYIANADGSGSPRRILSYGAEVERAVPNDWTPDGSHLLVTAGRKGRISLLAVKAAPAAGDQRTTTKLFPGSAMRGWGRFSPDGRLLAHLSDETGRFEVYVCPVAPDGTPGEPLLVSNGVGGREPRWSRNGKRLYYFSPRWNVLAVDIARVPKLAASSPKTAWDFDALNLIQHNIDFDILPDGNMLAVHRGQREGEVNRFDVVLNFDEVLRKRFQSGRK